MKLDPTDAPQRVTIVEPSDAERATWQEATENYVRALEAIVWPDDKDYGRETAGKDA